MASGGVGEVKIHLPEVMKYFERPKVDTARRRIHYVLVDPRAPLDTTSTSDIEFNVAGSTTEHIDLQESYLGMNLTFTKISDTGNHLAFNPGSRSTTTTESADENIADLPEMDPDDPFYVKNKALFQEGYLSDDADFIVPADGFLHTMFRNASLSLNGETVYRSNNDQPYRSILALKLRTLKEKRKRAKYRCMYTGDDGDLDEPNVWKARNQGGLERNERIRRRNKIQLADMIKCDFWENATHYLINGVSMQIHLQQAADEFRLQMTEGLRQNYAIKVEPYLRICYVTVSPDALQGINSGLQNSPAIYPFPRTDCKIVPIHSSVNEVRLPELFNNQVPSDIVVCMVGRDNFAGDFDLNPFNFKRNQIKNAAFYVDNVSIPGEPYEFEPESSVEDKNNLNRRGVDECLLYPLDMLYKVAGTERNGFDQHTLKDGNFLICFKTDPTVPADLSHWGVPKAGNTSLYLRFHEPIQGEQELIILARFPAVLQIDKDRNVEVK